jgi:hypothetical protein
VLIKKQVTANLKNYLLIHECEVCNNVKDKLLHAMIIGRFTTKWVESLSKSPKLGKKAYTFV